MTAMDFRVSPLILNEGCKCQGNRNKFSLAKLTSFWEAQLDIRFMIGKVLNILDPKVI